MINPSLIAYYFLNRAYTLQKTYVFDLKKKPNPDTNSRKCLWFQKSDLSNLNHCTFLKADLSKMVMTHLIRLVLQCKALSFFLFICSSHLHYLHRKETIQYHIVGRRLRFHHVSFWDVLFFIPTCVLTHKANISLIWLWKWPILSDLHCFPISLC